MAFELIPVTCLFTGQPTSAVAFQTKDRRRFIGIGSTGGLWIGPEDDQRLWRRVAVNLNNVTKCAVLDEYGLLIVLADKSLYVYRIEDLCPSDSIPEPFRSTHTGHKLSGAKEVHYFGVGELSGMTHVIYMKKVVSDSHFRILEPTIPKINNKYAEAHENLPPAYPPPNDKWFSIYKDFYIPQNTSNISFLKEKLVVHIPGRFEVASITRHTFRSFSLPTPACIKKTPALAKMIQNAKPLGFFRCRDEFLLCFDEFGLYVDSQGEPSRQSGVIQWDIRAQRAALHSIYILLFNYSSIEIRHIATGDLVQIISEERVRCVENGRNTHVEEGTGKIGRVFVVVDPKNVDEKPRVCEMVSV